MRTTPGTHREATVAAGAFGRRNSFVLKYLTSSLTILTHFRRQIAAQR
jgi:hypothetical protein